MATIITRAGKGSPLLNAEVDANFINLNSDKLESTSISLNTAPASGSGSLAYSSASTIFTYTPPDLSPYLTGNQAITLSGDVTGTGTTSISVNVEDDSHGHTVSTITDIGSIAGSGLSWTGSVLDVEAVSLKRVKLGKSAIFENVNPTASTIAWDVEAHKDNGYTHSTVTNPERVTVLETGSYRVIVNVNFINADTGSVTGQLELRKNGVVLPNTLAKGYSRGADYGDINVQIVTLVDLVANDYIDVLASIDDADSVNAFTTLATSEFIIERVTTEAVGNTWRAIHDTPVDGAAAISISSNWAFDHLANHPPTDADNTAANETSHADVVVDGDFASNGFLRRVGLGVYSVDNTVYAPQSSTYTKGESDAKYLLNTTDTLTGNLTVTGGITAGTFLSMSPDGGSTLDNAIFTNSTGVINFGRNWDEIRFRTAGSNKVWIDANGNVGIGTSSPNRILELADNTDTSPILRLTDKRTVTQANGLVGGIEFYQNDASGGPSTGGYIYSHYANISGDCDLRFGTGGPATEHMRLDSNGNLTISGTVDGRDVSADGTKLDGIAANANNYTFPYSISQSATGSTVPQRTAGGYIYATYFNTTPNVVSNNVTHVCVERDDDGFIRHGNSASIASFISDQELTNDISSSRGLFTATAGLEGQSSTAWPLEVLQTTSGKDALMSFHVAGDFAVNFGMDGSTNKLSVGGWSLGNVMHEIYHAGNLQPDCAKLGGRSFTDASTPSTIVGRNGSGDINARLFRSEYDATNGTIGYIMTQIDTVNNNYIRPSTPVQLVDGCGLIDNRTTQPHSLTIRNGSPTINFRDTDHRGFHLHCNSNLLYMLNASAVDSTTWSQVNGQWAFYINSTNNAANFGGSITAIGNITAYSDERIKSNIVTIDGALETVNQLRGVYYNRNDLTKEENAVRRTGVVAQEVQKVLPEVVRENEEKDVDNLGKTLEGGRKRLTVDYGNMVGLLIEAIKEQQTQIEELQGLIRTPWWKKLLGGR